MESVYIHIPFCKSICSYCDFCKVIYHGPWITQYLNALLAEIQDKYCEEEIKTLYIGGGTPSCLQEKDLKYLLDMIKVFKLSTDYEFTFECNLNDINEHLLDILKDYGVNRLSIGIETFDEDKLKFMERKHDFQTACNKMDLCRSKGFDNINVDFIYGIPGESLKVTKKDLDLLLKLNPDHISTYSLIIEDNTKIGITKMVPIPAELDATMYEYICDKLEDKKFIHYEISNFAKEGKMSRHNINYWLNNEYYGFGVGAHGYVHGVRYENTRSLTSYIGGKFLLKEDLLSRQEQMDNEIMLGLRLLRGINVKDFFLKYQVNIQEAYDLKEVLAEKEMIYEDGFLFINPDYIYVMNEILIKIL